VAEAATEVATVRRRTAEATAEVTAVPHPAAGANLCFGTTLRGQQQWKPIHLPAAASAHGIAWYPGFNLRNPRM